MSCNDDTAALKAQVPHMLLRMYGDATKGLDDQKATRGFTHDLTGQLLCPAGLDWNDEQYVPL
jgi:hypothetical protein